MNLYIGNIPQNADDFGLRKFFHMFGQEKATFRIVEKEAHGQTYRYGYAELPGDSKGVTVARSLIRKYNGKPMGGNRIVVREFCHRNYANDRRAVDWRSRPWNGRERRSTDRRGTFAHKHTWVAAAG